LVIFVLCSSLLESFIPPSFVWAPLIIEGFYMPLNFVWALLIIEDFLMSPSLGVILAKVIFQEKVTRLKRGLQMIYLAL
jgi:hypothetical protein